MDAKPGTTAYFLRKIVQFCSPLKHVESLYFSPMERDGLVPRTGLWIQGVLSQLLGSIGKELVLEAADTWKVVNRQGKPMEELITCLSCIRSNVLPCSGM